jgi:hypothetical protein
LLRSGESTAEEGGIVYPTAIEKPKILSLLPELTSEEANGNPFYSTLTAFKVTSKPRCLLRRLGGGILMVRGITDCENGDTIPASCDR